MSQFLHPEDHTRVLDVGYVIIYLLKRLFNSEGNLLIEEEIVKCLLLLNNLIFQEIHFLLVFYIHLP